ncbi:MAG TPA: glycosyltransferase family 2 protein [Acidobacteriaceae bacterium]|nr:glycosyltransferase family 2 protein [Acidobacteriaceae bacterium]
MSVLVGLAFWCAIIPALLWLWNMLIYREPQAGGCVQTGHCTLPDAISVLIPARNEEHSIGASLNSLLASRGVNIEIIVLDDGSTDRTAQIVHEFAARDPRVRLLSSVVLPRGWNGKQHACSVLAAQSHTEILCFLDADVRLAPEALASMAAFLERTNSDLVSGFPRQETQTPLECLLLPLIHFVLLSYLPLAAMRAFQSPGFGVGCGQFLMVRREAYQKTGGHSAIRTTMHDGLLLPQLFRRHGFRTDIADLTHLATCRMYHNASEVWRGLSKNATEGMAAPARILPFTLLLFCGQVLPLLLSLYLIVAPGSFSSRASSLILTALAASFFPRFFSVWKYRQSLFSALLHPLGVTVLLVLQWLALLRKLAGQPVTWKERAYRMG